MHIELADVLRCPRAHEGKHYCVLVPATMLDRDVRSGTVACPVCAAEYTITDGVADLRLADDECPMPAMAEVTPPPDDVAALLGVRGPGGYVVLVGSAGRLVDALAERLEGVHFVLVNPPTDIPPAPSYSLLVGGSGLPLLNAVARGVVLGAEQAVDPWLGEASRLLLPGLRLVALCEGVTPPGVEVLASGMGMTVGVRRERGAEDGAPPA